MIYLVCLVATLVGIGIHLGVAKKPLTKGRVVEVILLYILVILVGVACILAGIGHIFMGPETARGIGWQPGSPFQFEIGLANWAFGLLGILCIWKRGEFWTATGIGVSVLLLGCAGLHIYEIVVHHNYAPYNAGAGILFNDGVLPVIILILLGLRASFAKESRNS
jgi:Family of unknown function (DUF6790)